ECERWLPFLAALLDGELDPATERDVQAHLETCPDCPARMDDQARVASLVGAHAPAPELSPLALARLDRNLREELSRVRPPRPALGFVRELRAGPFFAAAAAIAIAALLVHQLSPRSERSVLAFPRRHLPELSHRDPIARGRAPREAAKLDLS